MRLFIIGLLIIIAQSVYSQQFIPLWHDGKMPNSKGIELEHIEARERITQVKTPGMYAFFTSSEENQNSAVLICPSGGYHHLTYNLGGFQIAKWFNTLGINAFVLIYRLPTSPDLLEPAIVPMQDAQRAMKLIRANASQWNIDTSKVGIMASSAGGHMASFIITHTEDYSNIGDSLDGLSFTPDFSVMVSPVISMGEFTHKGSLNNLLGENPSEEEINFYSNELHVTPNTCPTFLVHAQNDHTVSPMNSLLFYKAMIHNDVKGSLHIFPQGGHGIGLRNNPGTTNQWTVLCEEWLKEVGVIGE